MTTATYWQAIDRFRAVVAADPDREAVIYPQGQTASGLPDYRHLTYRELDEWSDTIGLHLAAEGVGRGTRTIVLVLPSPDLYAIMLGLLKIGAVPVVIDPGMGLRKMLNCLRAANAEAFIGIPQAHAARVLFRKYFRDVRVALTVGPRWFWGGPTLRSWGVPAGSGVPGTRTDAGFETRNAKVKARFTELMTALSDSRRDSDHRAPFDSFTLRDRVPAPADELLLIAYTTGSTGPAKAVEMTHGNLSAMVEQVHAARGRVEPGTSLITLPLVGILDMLLGSRCVLPPLVPSKVGSTEPAHVVDAINRFGVKTMFASPPC